MHTNCIGFIHCANVYEKTFLEPLERDVSECWHRVQDKFPSLRGCSTSTCFFSAFRSFGKDDPPGVFSEIAAEYSSHPDPLVAKILIVMARRHLLFYLHSKIYFRESLDLHDKWGSIVEIFLNTIRIHGSGAFYNQYKILKFVRSKIQSAARHQMATSMKNMASWDEKVEFFALTNTPIYTEGQEKDLAVRECIDALKTYLCEADWEVLEQRYLREKDCRTYADAHDITYESAKKRLTRAKKKAIQVLNEKFQKKIFLSYGTSEFRRDEAARQT